MSAHAYTNLQKQNKKILFEGAQGTLLDIDHGTYPYVTSSNTTAGGVCAQVAVLPPTHLIMCLALLKLTQHVSVAAHSQPNYLTISVKNWGHVDMNLAQPRVVNAAVDGLDAIALKRAVHLNGVTGICFTKLDVLDTLEEISICTSYKINGESVDSLPLNAENIEDSASQITSQCPAGKAQQ